MLHANRNLCVVCVLFVAFTMLFCFVCSAQFSNNEIKMNQLLNRPQEPKPPYPYYEEEVTFANQLADVVLSGTFTRPFASGPFPVLVLVSGMGPNDRNMTMLGHKRFLVIADYLTRHGIAVLRYDKRGVGKSTGVFTLDVTSADFAQDVVAAVQYLKTRSDVRLESIGLLGESEGGMIIPMVADQLPEIAFFIFMAGVVLTDPQSAAMQIVRQLFADGASPQLAKISGFIRERLMQIVMNQPSRDLAAKDMMDCITIYWGLLSDDLKEEAEKYLFAVTLKNAEHVIGLINSLWYRFFLTHDPVSNLVMIKKPVLALNGSLDHIVSSKQSLPLIAQTLANAGNVDVTTIEMPNLNHSFQTCLTGAIAEYGAIEETIAPEVLKILATWIGQRVK